MLSFWSIKLNDSFNACQQLLLLWESVGITMVDATSSEAAWDQNNLSQVVLHGFLHVRCRNRHTSKKWLQQGPSWERCDKGLLQLVNQQSLDHIVKRKSKMSQSSLKQYKNSEQVKANACSPLCERFGSRPGDVTRTSCTCTILGTWEDCPKCQTAVKENFRLGHRRRRHPWPREWRKEIDSAVCVFHFKMRRGPCLVPC